MSIFRNEFLTLPKFSREDKEYFLGSLAFRTTLELMELGLITDKTSTDKTIAEAEKETEKRLKGNAS